MGATKSYIAHVSVYGKDRKKCSIMLWNITAPDELQMRRLIIHEALKMNLYVNCFLSYGETKE